MPASRPDLPGDLRSPAPQAATLTRGHEPPDPHGTGKGPGIKLPPEPAPARPVCPGGGRPLPDPIAVRLCRIPDPAPPYDTDAVPGTRPGAGGPTTGDRASRPAGDQTTRPAGDRAAGPARPAVPAPDGFPGWPSRFAQVLAETLAGSRPPGQMVPWTTEMARVHIERLGPRLASGQRPRVRRVVTSHPTLDVMEMTVVVGFGMRVRALAVRLERVGPDPHAGRPQASGRQRAEPRWLCTAVEAA
jgi:Family of unknown function (DUF6459)